MARRGLVLGSRESALELLLTAAACEPHPAAVSEQETGFGSKRVRRRAAGAMCRRAAISTASFATAAPSS